MPRTYEATAHRLERAQQKRIVPLGGVPQIPTEIRNKITAEQEHLLTPEEMNRCNAAIDAAKQEIWQRHLQLLRQRGAASDDSETQ